MEKAISECGVWGRRESREVEFSSEGKETAIADKREVKM